MAKPEGKGAMSKDMQAPLEIETCSDLGKVALDMVNIMRSLKVAENVQREAVYHFFTGYAGRRINAARNIN